MDRVSESIKASREQDLRETRAKCGKVLEEVNPYMVPARDVSSDVISPNLLTIPLHLQTFCYLAPSWGSKFTFFRFSIQRSLEVFGPYNYLRLLCISIITHRLEAGPIND